LGENFLTGEKNRENPRPNSLPRGHQIEITAGRTTQRTQAEPGDDNAFRETRNQKKRAKRSIAERPERRREDNLRIRKFDPPDSGDVEKKSAREDNMFTKGKEKETGKKERTAYSLTRHSRGGGGQEEHTILRKHKKRTKHSRKESPKQDKRPGRKREQCTKQPH